MDNECISFMIFINIYLKHSVFKRNLVKRGKYMKKTFWILDSRGAIILFVIGILTILFSTPLAQFFYTTVEVAEEAYTLTSMDERSAFWLMINLNVVGAIISITGISGLVLSTYFQYKDLEVSNHK